MDKRIMNEVESDKIIVSENKIFTVDTAMMGIIYVNYKTFLEDKWRKRYFELKNNSMEHWNMKKKHKTCRTIKNIHKYNIEPIWKGDISKMFKFKIYKISNKKLFNKKTEYIFGSQNLEQLQLIRKKLIHMSEEHDIINIIN